LADRPWRTEYPRYVLRGRIIIIIQKKRREKGEEDKRGGESEPTGSRLPLAMN